MLPDAGHTALLEVRLLPLLPALQAGTLFTEGHGAVTGGPQVPSSAALLRQAARPLPCRLPGPALLTGCTPGSPAAALPAQQAHVLAQASICLADLLSEYPAIAQHSPDEGGPFVGSRSAHEPLSCPLPSQGRLAPQPSLAAAASRSAQPSLESGLAGTSRSGGTGQSAAAHAQSNGPQAGSQAAVLEVSRLEHSSQLQPHSNGKPSGGEPARTGSGLPHQLPACHILPGESLSQHSTAADRARVRLPHMQLPTPWAFAVPAAKQPIWAFLHDLTSPSMLRPAV